jgi:hypothetical protein
LPQFFILRKGDSFAQFEGGALFALVHVFIVGIKHRLRAFRARVVADVLRMELSVLFFILLFYIAHIGSPLAVGVWAKGNFLCIVILIQIVFLGLRGFNGTLQFFLGTGWVFRMLSSHFAHLGIIVPLRISFIPILRAVRMEEHNGQSPSDSELLISVFTADADFHQVNDS